MARTIRGAPPIAEHAVERFAQLLDELEDILSLLRHQLGLFPARRNKSQR
jgi:hypothetical protein